jgi:hypothetical protein
MSNRRFGEKLVIREDFLEENEEHPAHHDSQDEHY